MNLVQIHAGLRKASQESPTQRGLPSRSNCAFLCLKQRNAKNSSCDLTFVYNKNTWPAVWSELPSERQEDTLSICFQPFIVLGITVSQVESRWLYPNLLKKDTEAKPLSRG